MHADSKYQPISSLLAAMFTNVKQMNLCFFTCCSLYDVCSVPQAHKIKLVQTPGLLVSRLHRVLPPLVNHFILWVSICNYTEHMCVCDPWHYMSHPNDGYPVQTDLGPPGATFVLRWMLAKEKTGMRQRQK